MISRHSQIYGGIAYHRRSPIADMHGLFRVVLVAKTKHQALSQLRKLGITEWAFVQRTGSIVERNAAVPGKVMAATLQQAYLTTLHYSELVLLPAGRKRKTKKAVT